MERETMNSLTGNAWADFDLLCDALVKRYATDRQWHLLNHGSPRVRKKWRNALLRKARIAEKRRRR